MTPEKTVSRQLQKTGLNVNPAHFKLDVSKAFLHFIWEGKLYIYIYIHIHIYIYKSLIYIYHP